MKKYFFLDDEYVELYENAERIFHEPVKHGRPVLAPQTRLEGNRVDIRNAPLPSEDGRYWRLWYEGYDKNTYLPLYAESEDGLNWCRPNLKIVKYAGNKSNNVLNTGFCVNANRFNGIVLAPSPSRDNISAERYCALTFKGGAKPHGLLPLLSRDGLRWRLLTDPGHPLIPSSDEYRLVCDMEKKLLIATMKLYGFCMDIPLSVPEYGREVGLSTSTDGLTWTTPQFIYHADEEDRKAGAETLLRYTSDPDYRSPLYNNPEYSWTDIYNMPVFPYHGIYIGLPSMFHHSGYWIASKYSANQDGFIWPALAWSNDLKKWKRPLQRKPFIPLSPCTDKNIYDNCMIFACPPVRRNNELWFYYSGYRNSHTNASLLEKAGLDYAHEKEQGGIFLSRLRLDGFASMRAGERKAAVLTRPVIVDGASLHINARTKNGEILGEIRDSESGRVIPGFGLGNYLGSRNIGFGKRGERIRLAGLGTRRYDEQVKNSAVRFSGDEVDAVVSWHGGKNLSALKGKTIRILFALRNADIYSFWFD